MDEQLKPCPFCGQDGDLIFNGHAGRSPTGKEWWIACGNDACLYLNGVQSYESASAVIRAWNTRPIEDALRAELAELRAFRASVPWSALTFALDWYFETNGQHFIVDLGEFIEKYGPAKEAK